MKVGVFGDIHGNLPALDAVLNELHQRGIDHFICTGDIIGYVGWSPECIKRLREEGATVVAGNHDCRVRSDFHYVPSFPAAQAEHHVVTDQLSESDIDWLEELPTRIGGRDYTLAHSWPSHNREHGGSLHGFYADDRGVVPAHFPTAGSQLETQFGFLGHTHEQHAVNLDKFEGQSGLLLNPGSVGIPRDGQAQYAVVDLDTTEYELCETKFDPERTAERVESLANEHELAVLTE